MNLRDTNRPRPRPRFLILACMWLVFIVCPARAADTNSVLDAWLAAQKNVKTWNADFTQTRRLKVLTRPLVATGHVWFEAPNRFRWEVRRPSQTIALRQADQMWVIYPSLQRAERYPLTGPSAGPWREALELLEAGFPRDRQDLESRLHLLSLSETNAAWHLVFQPASAFARQMMTEIRLDLATNNYALTSTEIVLVDGSLMRNDFTNTVLNASLEDSVFEWKPPPDFTVSEPLSPGK